MSVCYTDNHSYPLQTLHVSVLYQKCNTYGCTSSPLYPLYKPSLSSIGPGSVIYQCVALTVTILFRQYNMSVYCTNHPYPLQTLYAGENRLQTLPHWFGRLVRLEELDLSNCDLIMLPESLASCTSLTRLWLSNNRYNHSQDLCFCLTFDLWFLRLSTLPYGIGNLKQLKELHVRNNKIRCFPASIEKLDLYTFSGYCLFSDTIIR